MLFSLGKEKLSSLERIRLGSCLFLVGILIATLKTLPTAIKMSSMTCCNSLNSI